MCSCLAEPGRCCRYTPSLPLPLQELLEQSLTLAVGQRTRASCTTCVQEGIKLSLHLGASIGRHLGQEFFSYAIARPARDLAGEVNLSPFGLEGRLLQLVELREVSFNEARHTTVAVTAFRPVEHSQYGRHGDRRNSLASLDEIGIVPMSVVRVFETEGGVIYWRTRLIWCLILCSVLLVLQAAISDCVSFDPFSFQQDGLGTPEVDVSRG